MLSSILTALLPAAAIDKANRAMARLAQKWAPVSSTAAAAASAGLMGLLAWDIAYDMAWRLARMWGW